MLIAQFFAAAVGGEVGNLVQQTGPVAKIVLLILLAFSVFSWAIILAKWSALKRARAQSGRFVRAFRKATRLQDVAAVAEQFKPSRWSAFLKMRLTSTAARAEECPATSPPSSAPP